MPVHKIPGGYQYGKTGKRYYGKDAYRKAWIQARAIEANRERDPEDDHDIYPYSGVTSSRLRSKRPNSVLKHSLCDRLMTDELYHHGVLGMKWGVRRYQPYGHGGYIPKGKESIGTNRKTVAKYGSSSVGPDDTKKKKLKKALAIGLGVTAAVGATAAAVYIADKISTKRTIARVNKILHQEGAYEKFRKSVESGEFEKLHKQRESIARRLAAGEINAAEAKRYSDLYEAKRKAEFEFMQKVRTGSRTSPNLRKTLQKSVSVDRKQAAHINALAKKAFARTTDTERLRSMSENVRSLYSEYNSGGLSKEGYMRRINNLAKLMESGAERSYILEFAKNPNLVSALH